MNLEELNAAALAADAEPTEILVYMYAYKDTKLNRFNPITCQPQDPKNAVDGLRAAILKGTITETQALDLQFCLVGTFDLITGKTVLLEEPKVLVDCNALFLMKGGTVNVA